MNFGPNFEPLVSLREEYKERTRRRILDTALAFIRQGGEQAVTITDIAEVAGVAERTVYRHFETRDALIEAVWQRMGGLIGPQAWPETADALIERPRRLFPRLDQQCELVRAYLHRRTRRNAPMRPNVQHQQAMLKCVREELPDLDEGSLRRRAAIAQVIASAYAWELMQESWGFDGEDAADAAAEALEILLNRRLAY